MLIGLSEPAPVNGSQTIWSAWQIAIADIAVGVTPSTSNMIGMPTIAETYSETQTAISISADGQTLYMRKEGAGSENRTHRVGRISAVFDPTDTQPGGALPSLRLSTEEIMVREGESNTFNFDFTSNPGGDVTVDIESSDETLVTVNPTQVIIPAFAWETALEVTVNGLVDLDTIPSAAIITLSAAGGDIPAGHAVTVNVTVQEPRRLMLSRTAMSINEGSSGTFDVWLSEEPTGNVTVAVTETDSDISINPAQLIFTPDNWDTAQEVTVTGVEDSDTADDSGIVSLSASGGDFNGVSPA